MSESVDSVVLDVLAKHAGLERGDIGIDTPLQSSGVDSLKMVEIIFDLEEHFDISIPDPDFVGQQSAQFNTASDVVRVVKELMQQQGKAS